MSTIDSSSLHSELPSCQLQAGKSFKLLRRENALRDVSKHFN